MLSQSYYIFIYRGVSAPEHGRDLVYILNSTGKRFLFQLMANVQLLGSKVCDTHMAMHSVTSTADISLARESQKHLSSEVFKYVVIDQVKYKK